MVTGSLVLHRIQNFNCKNSNWSYDSKILNFSAFSWLNRIFDFDGIENKNFHCKNSNFDCSLLKKEKWRKVVTLKSKKEQQTITFWNIFMMINFLNIFQFSKGEIHKVGKCARVEDILTPVSNELYKLQCGLEYSCRI